jgi:SAM-dependent methyltransferase
VSVERRYLPAASLDILLPVYDPIMRLLGFTPALAPLVAQAALEPGMRVLDLGCGTGTLAVLITAAHPGVEVTGLDPDPRALARAARKAARANVAVRFDRGFGDALPYPDAAFDRVFSSMMFHHLPPDEQAGVLAEARRVLTPGGRLELLDFAGGTHSFRAHILGDRAAGAAADERLLRLMRGAGFRDPVRLDTWKTMPGSLGYYQARA